MLLIQLSDESVYENSRSEALSRYTWVDMQNYRDPPPYPGHSKQVYPNQPGFRQSFSGSETSTDVSLSSTENLATSQRQEPQGEETQTTFNYNLDDGSSYSILERLGMPPGALDSAGKFPTSGSANSLSAMSSYYQERSNLWYQSDLSTASTSLGLSSSTLPVYSKGHLTVPQWQLNSAQSQRDRNFSSSQIRGATPTSDYVSSAHTTDVISSSQSSHLMTTRSGEYSSYNSTSVNKTATDPAISLPHLSSSSCHQYLSPRVPPVSTYHHPHPYVNAHWTVGSGDSSSSSHSSLTTFSHSAPLPRSSSGTIPTTHSGHATPVSFMNSLPPPPEYPGNQSNSSPLDKNTDIRSCRSYETMDKVNVQRSHPDLRLCSSSPGLYNPQEVKYQSPRGSGSNSADETDQVTIAAKASHMVEMLTDENRLLREELTSYAIRVARLQKFEMEIQKVHESHKALLKSGEKREALWLAMKRKLEEKIQTLESQSTDTGKAPISTTEAELKTKMLEKDAMISKLLAQSQELSLSRDELEGENTQLTLTITELRAHVEIFENALLAAQTKVLTLEEEKHASMDKLEQLQKALTTLQTASEKQEKKERDMRALLEKELDMYRAQEKAGNQKKPDAGKDDLKGSGTLRKMLDEKDAKILQLETELAAMEQKYVKETTLRQLNLGETNQSSKDVRLSSLEKSSSDVGKLIDEAKTEKLKHIEEMHHSQKNVAELEAKVRQLQTQLVEKDALLKIFQRAPLAMARSSSLHALCHSPLHSPRPSLLSSHCWPGSNQSAECSTTSSSTYREYSTIRHMKTGSAGAVELGHKMALDEDLLSKVQNLNAETKNDSEDEVKLWHV
ncbi:angiomotin-like isoform X1 [Biomphalaria glabrata]|uniref:Angiomotin-like isoform X1 n=2 Tax=Biomphalaria glabrata TaxID=6526 RepID=A0A9W2Z0G7_BIOGL|nr:angiomotin-like isoform X1 [Biomphalaria glabrata]XP_055868444.1 angiomotin-like isoform X1 [Biomphalaria glabrata]